MVGTPGWSAETLFALLDHRPLLRGRVHHAAGLSTPALAQLIAGSRALLVPSLAEGFSLPLLEARALNVPVIASDIAVHRERADAGVCLLPCDDEPGWLAAIDAVPRQASRAIPAVDKSLGELSYCEDILRFVEGCRKAKSSPGQAVAPMGTRNIASSMAMTGEHGSRLVTVHDSIAGADAMPHGHRALQVGMP